MPTTWILPFQPKTNARPSSRPVWRSTNFVPQSRAAFKPSARTNIFSLNIANRRGDKLLHWVHCPRAVASRVIDTSGKIAEVAHKSILVGPIACAEAEVMRQSGNIHLVVNRERFMAL